MGFIPFSGSGDFMIDMRDVRVSMIAVLRDNGDKLDLEHFNGTDLITIHISNQIISSQLMLDGEMRH